MTGALPRLHLAKEIGGRPVPTQRTPLGIDERALACVRDALLDVARTGTAAGYGLERWPVALKTGTAELGGPLKLQNAWLAGYLPPRAGRPAVAFAMVVFDTELNGAEACAPRLAEFLRGFYREGGA
jgi:cell division protein FtsI/penicillin-binding protein 2